jgi:hypothetical protein
MRWALIAIAIGALSASCGGDPPAPVPISASAQTPASATVAVEASSGRRTLPSSLDVDGDGTVGSHTDALLILRYVAGFEGRALIEGAVSPECQRCTAEQIAAYIDSL